MGRTNRIGLALACLVVVLAFLSAGSRLISVHQETSDWALWPRVVPSKVQFAGRDYNCGPDARALGAAAGNPSPVADKNGSDGGSGGRLSDGGVLGPADMALLGLTVRGKTAGGADIYGSAATVPDTIWVRSVGGLFSCPLMGGP